MEGSSHAEVIERYNKKRKMLEAILVTQKTVLADQLRHFKEIEDDIETARSSARTLKNRGSLSSLKTLLSSYTYSKHTFKGQKAKEAREQKKRKA